MTEKRDDCVREGFVGCRCEVTQVGKLADARRFQRGAPGYGQNVSAAEFKQKLSLPP